MASSLRLTACTTMKSNPARILWRVVCNTKGTLSSLIGLVLLHGSSRDLASGLGVPENDLALVNFDIIYPIESDLASNQMRRPCLRGEQILQDLTLCKAHKACLQTEIVLDYYNGIFFVPFKGRTLKSLDVDTSYTKKSSFQGYLLQTSCTCPDI